jgi:poly-beta-1,6-N-acetyl-D-glucosamine synthase
MRLRKIGLIDPLLLVPHEKKKNKRLALKTTLKYVVIAGLALASYKGLQSGQIDLYASLVKTSEYFSKCVADLFSRPWWQIALFFLPALLFDTTRYYLPNTIVFFISLIKKVLPVRREEPEIVPLVTVILPAYNEGSRIRSTINSILESDYPNLEIVVVDDGSTDMTQNICRVYESKGQIKYFRMAARGGKPSALNLGFNLARGEYIIHFDAEIFAYRTAIEEVIAPFRDPRVGVVSGNLKVSNEGKSLATRLQAAEYGMGISLHRQWLAMTDSLQIASGAFSAFRREVLEKLMGEDPETGDDLDITLKARKAGYKVAFAPRAIAMTNVPESFIRVFRQRVRWDECYIRINLRKHGNIANPRRFRLGDFFAVAADVIFNLFLMLIFPVYIVWIAVYVPNLFLFILTATYLFYTAMNAWQFFMVAILSDTTMRDMRFILYAPLFFFYSLFLRGTRLVAYVLEFFRSTYLRDGFFPENVWDSMPRY